MWHYIFQFFFFCQFYGIESIRGCDADERQHYLVLEDLTQGMRRPCVRDIKILPYI
jgi:hypothetical protein